MKLVLTAETSGTSRSDLNRLKAALIEGEIAFEEAFDLESCEFEIVEDAA